MNVLKSMEIQSRHSEMSVISQVSAVEGCLLSRGPLYYYDFIELNLNVWGGWEAWEFGGRGELPPCSPDFEL